MTCAWDELIRILPLWMRIDVDRLGKNSMQELRFRVGYPLELVHQNKSDYLDRKTTNDDINYVINTASQYSPWTSQSISQGYLTAPGGHRIGICGEAVVLNGEVKGIKYATSLCVRVARDFIGISNGFQLDDASVLIIGVPGSGKTTLLRDLIRNYSSEKQQSISVLDERGEIFPTINGKMCFTCGDHTDILSNCSKRVGIPVLLRTMCPSCIAVDEITLKEDCDALADAYGCGVKLIATAHAGNMEDLMNRNIYRSLIEDKVFQRILIMQEDKSWVEERL